VGQVFNVGSTDEITIAGLARRIVERAGSASSMKFIPYSQAYGVGFEDMHRRLPDTKKLRALTGWAPERDLDDILEETIAEAIREVSGGPVVAS
jgi:UDP-glucose 4-epimerase